MSITTITTVRNGGNLSRYELLKWINNTAHENIKRIEDLCTGVVYCRLMEEIFPNIINMKRVKMAPRLPYEFVQNMRLLQDAFNILELEQPVPIDLIIQGRFKHNFEFIQFFKKFYESQTLPPPEKKFSGSRKSLRSSHSLAKSMSRLYTKQSRDKGYNLEVPAQTEDITPECEDVSEKYPMPMIAEETENTEEHCDEENQDIQNDRARVREERLEAMIKKMIHERDFAYNKLILIEEELAGIKANGPLLAISRRIINVLKAPREDGVQAVEGPAADPALPPQ